MTDCAHLNTIEMVNRIVMSHNLRILFSCIENEYPFQKNFKYTQFFNQPKLSDFKISYHRTVSPNYDENFFDEMGEFFPSVGSYNLKFRAEDNVHLQYTRCPTWLIFRNENIHEYHWPTDGREAEGSPLTTYSPKPTNSLRVTARSWLIFEFEEPKKKLNHQIYELTNQLPQKLLKDLSEAKI